MVVVQASALRSKFVGESEMQLASLLAQARQSRPVLLLLDQLEVLAPNSGVSGGVRKGRGISYTVPRRPTTTAAPSG